MKISRPIFLAIFYPALLFSILGGIFLLTYLGDRSPKITGIVVVGLIAGGLSIFGYREGKKLERYHRGYERD